MDHGSIPLPALTHAPRPPSMYTFIRAHRISQIQGFMWMLVLLGHFIISILASQNGLQMQGGMYHMFFWEAAPKPQKTKNKGASRLWRSYPVNSVLKTPISCLSQLISSTNPKPKSLKKVALIALLGSDLVSLTQQGRNWAVPQKTKNGPHWGTAIGCEHIFYESRALPGSFTGERSAPGRLLCLCFEI